MDTVYSTIIMFRSDIKETNDLQLIDIPMQITSDETISPLMNALAERKFSIYSR